MDPIANNSTGKKKKRGGKRKKKVSSQKPPPPPDSKPPPPTLPPPPPQPSPPQDSVPAEALSAMSLEDKTNYRGRLKQNELAIQKEHGTTGQKIKLLGNMFKLDLYQLKLHRYLVEFEPEIAPESIELRRIALQKYIPQLNKDFGLWAFDGSTIISQKKIQQIQLTGEHTITISYMKALDNTLESQEVNTVVNILVKKLLRALKLIKYGRNYYHSKPVVMKQQDLSIYSGFSVSVQNTQGGLEMGIDMTHRVVRRLTVRSTMDAIYKAVESDLKDASVDAKFEEYKKRCNSEIRGSVVLALYNKRIWRVDLIDFDKNASSTFKKGTEDVSFRDYYQNYHKLPLGSDKETRGVLINLQKRKGEEPRETVLMPDFCHLTGVTDMMRSDFSLMRILADKTRLPPSARMLEIKKLVKDIIENTDVTKEIEKMPIKLSTTPTEINARILGPFNIQMPKKNKFLDKNKNFSYDIREAGFFKSDHEPRMNNWAVVYEKFYERTARNFGEQVHFLSQQQGAKWSRPNFIQVEESKNKTTSWRNTLSDIVATKPECVLALVPRGDITVYSMVKNLLIVQNSITSQCINTDTLKNPKLIRPVAGNIFKQIMSKEGFQSWKVDIATNIKHRCFKEHTMIVGIDISHDKKAKGTFGNDDRRGKSTVGVTASYDSDFNCYHSFISWSTKGEDYFQESQLLMIKCLEAFKSKNKVYPQNIILFRDGVGNSQLNNFVRKEIQNYHHAFAQIGKKDIKLTVAVVQKRITTRLFDTCDIFNKRGTRCHNDQRCNGQEPYHSPMPGTVVDSGIVSTNYREFYLVPSMAPPRATASPVRIIIVRDDIDFSMDQFENFCNQMAYLYFTWPGPIKVPAPLQYAHKLSILFGKHVNGEPNQKMLDKLFYL